MTLFLTLCIFCDFSLLGEPHDQGLVFKWGSLVGIRMPSEGATGTLPFVASNVEFTPAGFTGIITDHWSSVPYCNDGFTDYGNTTTDHLITVHNPVIGIGDICRHMGVVDGASWRIPTIAEWQELYGSNQPNSGRDTVLGNGWAAGNFYSLSGRAMGAGWKYVSISGSDANARVTNVDPWINGAIFLPTSGYREPSIGAIYQIGANGLYWSSTASTSDNAYNMQFNSSTVAPQYSDLRAYAWSIRCIRE